MFNQNGLSLEQAPPLSVVLRFFVTATLFGIAAGSMLLLYGGEIFDPATSAARITTHLFALGVMASFILGALFQMLPVIAGVVLPSPTRKATFVHLTFTAGVLILIAAFYTATYRLYLLSALLLGAALLYAVILMLYHLIRLPGHSASSRGMQLALFSFGITLLLGLYMLTALGGLHTGTEYMEAKAVHYTFGLFGWITLLIVSISFQVVEMFYVTPPYPEWMLRYLTFAIVTLLIIKTVLLFSGIPATAVDGTLALLFILYAGTTLLRLQRRKRPTSDATVWFWRFGMAMLIVTMLLMLFDLLIPSPALHPLSYLAFTLFALSIVLAMVYKIVPFLTWFHLSNQGYMMAPMMHDIIHPKRVKVHFYLHSLLFVTLLGGLLFPPLFRVSGILVMLSFGWLLYHLIYAIYLYRHTQKHTEKFNMQI